MRALLTAGMLVLVGTSAAQAQHGRDLHVDVAASRIFVVTHRTGLMSFLGHEHAILANQWAASVCFDAPGHTASRTQISIDAASLSIDADSARRLAGIGRGPSTKQRTEIQRKMFASLAPADFPEIAFASDSVRVLPSGTLVVFGKLTIKGRSNPVAMPVTQRDSGGRVHLDGRMSIRQSVFGIRPESIGGVVKVADEINLHVQWVGDLTSTPCR